MSRTPPGAVAEEPGLVGTATPDLGNRAQFLLRAASYFASHGITRIERVMTDNHFSYDVLAPATRDAWLSVTTAVAGGL